MSFRFVHLTGRYCGGSGVDLCWRDLRDHLYADVMDQSDRKPLNAVFFTGDITVNGRPHEFAEATEFFRELYDRLSPVLKDAPLFIIPGDRDVDRASMYGDEFGTRKSNLQELLQDPLAAEKFFKDEQYRKSKIGSLFLPYTDWLATLSQQTGFRCPLSQPGSLPGDFAATLPYPEYPIGVVGMNSVLLAAQTGNAYVSSHQLHHVCPPNLAEWKRKHSVTILLTHYSSAWFGGLDARFPGRVADHFQMHLCGQAGGLSPGQGNEAEVFLVQPLGAAARYECSARALCHVDAQPGRHDEVLGYFLGRIEFPQQRSPGKPEVASLYLRARRYQAHPHGRGRFVRDPMLATPRRGGDESSETGALPLSLHPPLRSPSSRLQCTIQKTVTGWLVTFNQNRPNNENALFLASNGAHTRSHPLILIKQNTQFLPFLLSGGEQSDEQISLVLPSAEVAYL